MVITILTITITFAQQIILKGQVSIHNSKYRTGQIEYVPNAFVSAPFAGSKSTDADGKFGLTFVGMDAGTTIKIAAEKNGLEVVNAYDLERVVIGRKPLLRIYLTLKGQLAQAQTELYNISRTALFAKKDALITRLLSDEKESQAALAEVQKAWGMKVENVADAIELLESKIAELNKRLPEFALELAAQNLDFASDLYIQAYQHYEAGDIEKAIAILDDQQLDAAYEEATAAIEKAEADKAKLEESIAQRELEIDQIIESLELKARSHRLLFQYKDAIAVYHKIETILVDRGQESGLKAAHIDNELGILYQELGDYEKAYDYLRTSVITKEQLLDNDALSLATAYINYASVLHRLGNYQDALKLQHQALDIQLLNWSADDIRLANLYDNMALVYKDLGSYERALAVQQKSVNLHQKVKKKNTDWLVAYNNLSIIYIEMDEPDLALETQLQARTIAEQSLDTNDPRLASAYNNLAIIFQARNDHKAALELLEKAILILERTLPPNHPKLAATYTNLALNYKDTEEIEKAIETQQKAIKIWLAIVGKMHPDLATAYNNLSVIYQAQEKHTEAIVAQKEALNIRLKMLPSDHPYIGESFSTLAVSYFALNNSDMGIGSLQDAKGVFAKSPAHRLKLAQIYSRLATAFADVTQLDSAVYAATQAYSIYNDILPKTDSLTLVRAAQDATVCHMLRGRLRKEEQRYDEAIKDHKMALEYAVDSISTARLKMQMGMIYAERARAQPTAAYEILRADFEVALQYVAEVKKPKLHIELGLLHYKNGYYQLALDNYETAYRLDPSHTLIYNNNSGLAYAKIGQYEAAKTRFATVEKAIPDNPITYRNWAVFYALQKEYNLAFEQLEKAMELGWTVEKIEAEEAFEGLRGKRRYGKIIAE